MSNNEAPERICLTADSVHKSIPEWAAEGEGVEYIRADLIHKGMKQRIAELEAERDALASYVEHLAHLVEQGEEARITAFVVEQNVVPFKD